jgi:hypothetical protein
MALYNYIMYSSASSISGGVRPESAGLYFLMALVLATVGGSLLLNDGLFELFHTAGCISAAILLTGAVIIDALVTTQEDEEEVLEQSFRPSVRQELRRRQYDEDIDSALEKMRRRKKE